MQSIEKIACCLCLSFRVLNVLCLFFFPVCFPQTFKSFFSIPSSRAKMKSENVSVFSVVTGASSSILWHCEVSLAAQFIRRPANHTFNISQVAVISWYITQKHAHALTLTQKGTRALTDYHLVRYNTSIFSISHSENLMTGWGVSNESVGTFWLISSGDYFRIRILWLE